MPEPAEHPTPDASAPVGVKGDGAPESNQALSSEDLDERVDTLLKQIDDTADRLEKTLEGADDDDSPEAMIDSGAALGDRGQSTPVPDDEPAPAEQADATEPEEPATTAPGDAEAETSEPEAEANEPTDESQPPAEPAAEQPTESTEPADAEPAAEPAEEEPQAAEAEPESQETPASEPEAADHTPDETDETPDTPEADAAAEVESSDNAVGDAELETALDAAIDEASAQPEPDTENDGFEDVASILGDDTEDADVASLDEAIAQAAQQAIDDEPVADQTEAADDETDLPPAPEEDAAPAEPEPAPVAHAPPIEAQPEPVPTPATQQHPEPAQTSLAWHAKLRTAAASAWQVIWARAHPSVSVILDVLTAWARGMSPSSRQTITYIGFITAFNALCLWGWLLLRSPSQPNAQIDPAQAPRMIDDTPEQASVDSEK